MRRAMLLLLVLPACSSAESREFCTYIDASGRFLQVTSRETVPEQHRAAAKCFVEARRAPAPPAVRRGEVSPVGSTHSDRQRSGARPSAAAGALLAAPEEIDLSGTVRREQMISALGPIELRWPRKVEVLFGRTPQRAMADAARTVSRALKHAGFPQRLRGLNKPWQVVFMDQELSRSQIPAFLIENCHPGWMTPPANVYIVAQRVAGGCGGRRSATRVADRELAKVLIHEIGHVLEHYLLKEQGHRFHNRMRAEGFASWFEQYASDYSAVIAKGSVRSQYMSLARSAIAQSPNSFRFSGSGADYARASLFFHAVVDRRQVQGLMDVYDTMLDKRVDFLSALLSRMNWSEKRLFEEAARQAQR